MAARTLVLDTAELIEMILFALPTRNLPHSQKVSKQRQAAIQNSPKLQQALFFRALPGGQFTVDEARARYGKALENPLLRPLFERLAGKYFMSSRRICYSWQELISLEAEN